MTEEPGILVSEFHFGHDSSLLGRQTLVFGITDPSTSQDLVLDFRSQGVHIAMAMVGNRLDRTGQRREGAEGGMRMNGSGRTVEPAQT